MIQPSRTWRYRDRCTSFGPRALATWSLVGLGLGALATAHPPGSSLDVGQPAAVSSALPDRPVAPQEDDVQTMVEVFDRRWAFVEVDLRATLGDSDELLDELLEAYRRVVRDVLEEHTWKPASHNEPARAPSLEDVLASEAWAEALEEIVPDAALRARWADHRASRRARLMDARYALVELRFSNAFRLRDEERAVFGPELRRWTEAFEPDEVRARSGDLVHRVTRDTSIRELLSDGQREYLKVSRKNDDGGRLRGRTVADEFGLEAEVLARRHELDPDTLTTLRKAGVMLGRRLERENMKLRANRRKPFETRFEPQDDPFWTKLLRTHAPQAIGDQVGGEEQRVAALREARLDLIVVYFDQRLRLSPEQRAQLPEAFQRLLDKELKTYFWRFDELGGRYVWEATGALGPDHLPSEDLAGSRGSNATARGVQEALKSILTRDQQQELGL